MNENTPKLETKKEISESKRSGKIGETNVERRTWNNKDGEAICEVEAGFEPYEKKHAGISTKTKELKSLVLKGNNGEEIDLLKLVHADKEHEPNLRILVTEKTDLGLGFFRESEGIVVGPSPNTPKHLAVLLHELGHLSQSKEELYKKISADYMKADWARWNPGALEKLAEKNLETIPGIDRAAIEQRLEIARMLQEKFNNTKQTFDEKRAAEISIKNQKIREALGLNRVDASFDANDPESAVVVTAGTVDTLFANMPGVGLEMTNETPSDEDLQIAKNWLSRSNFYEINLENGASAKFEGEKLVVQGIISERSRGIRLEMPVSQEKIALAREIMDEKSEELERVMGELAVNKVEYDSYLVESGLLKTADLPRILKERDANARALNWLRELKKQGIDLIKAEIQINSDEEPDCEMESYKSVNNAYDMIQASITGHKSSLSELRLAKGKSLKKK